MDAEPIAGTTTCSDVKEIKMPILASSKRWTFTGFPDFVMLPRDCEAQAIKNHSQTLDRLAGRGGLSVCEAVALMQSREYRSMTVFELVDAFREYHWV